MAARISRRTVLLGGGGLSAAALVPAAGLAFGQAPYALPVNLSGLVPGSTTQAVLATASGYRTARATVSCWARQADGSWVLQRGPWSSWIGAGGFARSGTKREGDRHSPTGSFGIPISFGTRARPVGLRLPYHRLHYPYEIWVENSRSRYYNELVDIRRVGARAIGDRESAVTYPLGAFIAYNSRRVPHLGSAIFLHPSHNSPTIGCVSLPSTQLLSLLRWLDPGHTPRIVMGVTSELLSLGGPLVTPSPSSSPSDPGTPEPTPTDSSAPTPAPSGGPLGLG